MARTNDSAVEGIVEVDPTIDLEPFIATANELVTELCVPEGYTDVRLELIERWLAAHFYSIRATRSAQEQAGSVIEFFQYKVDIGLDVTLHGQQAQQLDTAGALAALNAQTNDGVKRRAPNVIYMGTEPS